VVDAASGVLTDNQVAYSPTQRSVLNGPVVGVTLQKGIGGAPGMGAPANTDSAHCPAIACGLAVPGAGSAASPTLNWTNVGGTVGTYGQPASFLDLTMYWYPSAGATVLSRTIAV
jgi:hypothetical protein